MNKIVVEGTPLEFYKADGTYERLRLGKFFLGHEEGFQNWYVELIHEDGKVDNVIWWMFEELWKDNSIYPADQRSFMAQLRVARWTNQTRRDDPIFANPYSDACQCYLFLANDDACGWLDFMFLHRVGKAECSDVVFH